MRKKPKQYCCELFKKWMYGGDEYLDPHDDGTFYVSIRFYGDIEKINFCPFCGTNLLHVPAPQNSNVTYDGRVIDGE